MKDRMKDDAMQREHHELEKAFRNHERSNDDHLNDTLNKHTESISDDDIIKKSNERERKQRRNKFIKFSYWKQLQYKAQRKAIVDIKRALR